jgi:hypothetical protein
MNGDISVDFGDALPYYTEKLLALLGHDSATREANERFVRLQRIGVERASHIQCIGMPNPVAIGRLYQISRLEPSTGLDDLIVSESSAVIKAGPGRGKTTLLHWIFVKTLRSKELLPLLFTLRLPSGVEDLVAFIKYLKEKTKLKGLKEKLLLLVDGYDEIDESERKIVSEHLSEFNTFKRGSFILTCRSYYALPNLLAKSFEVAPFSIEDSERFVTAFSGALGVTIDGELFCRELHRRGFGDFVGHPLMLTLACVLRTGPLKSIPSNAIGLIRRALDTLTFRWDESKGLARDSASPVDGEVRQRCLMRVAFECIRVPVGTEVVESHVRKQLSLEQCEGIDTSRLLDEMARWYGILVPTAAGEWEFVHKALHDFLAARYWVESGRFNPSSMESWSTRASYACCLLPDATAAVCCALRLSDGLTGFIECIHNRAAFDNHVVARAVHRAFRENKVPFTINRQNLTFSLKQDADFFGLTKTDFLRALLSTATESSEGRLVVAAYCLSELHRRAETVQLDSLPEYLRGLLDPLHGANRTWVDITVARSNGPQQVRIRECLAL